MISNPSPRRNVHLREKRRFKVGYLLLFGLGLGVLCVAKPTFQGPHTGEEMRPPDLAQEAIAVEKEVPAPVVTVEESRIRKGDTLYDILKARGVTEADILSLSGQKVEGVVPSRLVAGKKYRVFSEGDRITEYHYEPDEDRILKISFQDSPPALAIEPIPYEILTLPVSGVIRDSLFEAVEDIGEKPSLAMDMADIFAWQVDFFRDLRQGDAFTVLVEKYYRDGDFARYGKILAARFVNNGVTHNAYLFNPQGSREDYFDESGGSLRKQFLKSPLKFRRISSGFSRARLHPVTGKRVPHLGVDYAAPTGTPIMAVGDGKVVLKKHDSINGRIVKVRHNSTYSSAYAHMNSFASGIGLGSRVSQGQIIGYVGRSGRATGPHLHFAMYRNGKYVDPRGITVPRASSIAEADRPQFQISVQELVELLEKRPDDSTVGEAGEENVLR